MKRCSSSEIVKKWKSEKDDKALRQAFSVEVVTGIISVFALVNSIGTLAVLHLTFFSLEVLLKLIISTAVREPSCP